MPERWQYPSKAEPVSTEVPSFGWFVQPPMPVLPVPQPVQGPSYAAPETVPAPTVPDFDWSPGLPDVVPLRPGIIAVGNEARGPPADVVALPFDWFVPPADVVRPPAQLVPEQFVLGEPPRIPDYDWQVPPADVTRPPERRILGGAVLGEPPAIPGFDWLSGLPDVVRPPARLVPEGLALGQVPIIPKLDWLLEPADVVRPLHQTRPGFFALVEFGIPIPLEVVDLDWLVQPADVTRPPVRLVPEGYALGEPPAIPAYDWVVQGPEPLPAPTRPVSDVVLVLLPPTVFLDSWWVQGPGWIARRQPTYFIPSQPPVVIPQEEVTLDKWWLQFIQVYPAPTRPASQVTFPQPIVIGEFVPVVFEMRRCLVLWDLEFNRLFPDASGFIAVVTFVPDPSGWEPDDSEDCNTLWNLQG